MPGASRTLPSASLEGRHPEVTSRSPKDSGSSPPSFPLLHSRQNIPHEQLDRAPGSPSGLLQLLAEKGLPLEPWLFLGCRQPGGRRVRALTCDLWLCKVETLRARISGRWGGGGAGGGEAQQGELVPGQPPWPAPASQVSQAELRVRTSEWRH